MTRRTVFTRQRHRRWRAESRSALRSVRTGRRHSARPAAPAKVAKTRANRVKLVSCSDSGRRGDASGGVGHEVTVALHAPLYDCSKIRLTPRRRTCPDSAPHHRRCYAACRIAAFLRR